MFLFRVNQGWRKEALADLQAKRRVCLMITKLSYSLSLVFKHRNMGIQVPDEMECQLLHYLLRFVTFRIALLPKPMTMATGIN